MVALVGRSPAAPGTARRVLGRSGARRGCGRRARVLATLDVVGAAGGVRRRRTSRSDWHARHPGLVLAPGPTPRGDMTIRAKTRHRRPAARFVVMLGSRSCCRVVL